MNTGNEQVNQVKRLIAVYRKEHGGSDPSPEWVVSAIDAGHPAAKSDAKPFAEIEDPAWWREVSDRFLALAEMYRRALEQRRAK